MKAHTGAPEQRLASQNEPAVEQDQEGDSTRLILHAIESRDRVTQRGLAAELGIALGLTNIYLKRCLSKGLIKVRKAPARRYAYYLTSKGFTEKARLTAKFLRRSLSFFRLARQDCAELFDQCRARGIEKVAFVGAGDLCEIASLAALDSEVEVVGVLDELTNRQKVAGIPVVRRLDQLPAAEVLVITDTRDPQACFERLAERHPPEKILFPGFLHLSRGRNGGREGRF